MKYTIQEKLIESFFLYKDKIAIKNKDREITYNELDIRSNKVRDWLIETGSKPGDLIGIFMKDKINVIVTIIGILKAKCVIVPLDIEYPKGRLQTLFEITEIQKVVIDDEDTDIYEIDELTNNRILKISIQEIVESRIEPSPNVQQYGKNDLIYIYFTSGSTGLPKGIKGKNSSLCHFVDWEIETFNVNHNTRISQFTSPSHDPFLRDIFVPLCSGGTICIPNDKLTLLDARELNAWINNNEINMIHCTPSLFKQMIKGIKNKNEFSSLNYVLMAGERINPKSIANWYETFGSRIQLVNLYGPTETTLAKLYYFISQDDIEKNTIPIGKPIKGSRAIIFDNEMKLCTVGMTGEIYIRTPHRSLGYYKDEELTNKKFIKNPYSDDPEDLLYKTGDLGRILSNGEIEFLGRVDRQVKIRGYRIEPSEIETIIKTSDGVEEVVVVARETLKAEIYLCAYIIGTVDESSLINYLKDRLPNYMIPQYIEKIENIPLNANGKINYEDLPLPNTNEIIKPVGETETKLAKIWENIFDVENISSSASFFEMGGHSLNVMELFANVNEEFNVQISFGDVIDNNSLIKLANIIDEKSSDETSGPFYSSPVKEYYALSSAQIGQFVTSYYDGGNIINNISKVLKVNGPFDKLKFEQAIRKLIERHESLRTSFKIVNGEPVQIVHSKVEFNIIDINQSDKSLEEIIQSFIQPFDLRVAPLIRVGLMKYDDYYLLLFDMHHIIADGYSLSIIVKEFLELYENKELPPVNKEYKDFSEWQKNCYFGSDKYKEDEAYWKKMFSDECAPLNMPADYPRLIKQVYEGKQVEFTIDKEMTKNLRNSLVNTSSTLFVYLLTAYNILLNKYTGQQDITVGTAIAGRNHPELKNTVGMFVNTLALRNLSDENKTFLSFLNDVKDRVYKAFDHQDLPFERLLEVIPLTRYKGKQPLFDTMFILQNINFPELTINDTEFSTVDIYNNISKYDFRLEAYDNDEDISFKFEYNSKLFKTSTIEKWIEFYIRILNQVISDVNITLEDINILSNNDIAESISDFNSNLLDNYIYRK